VGSLSVQLGSCEYGGTGEDPYLQWGKRRGAEKGRGENLFWLTQCPAQVETDKRGTLPLYYQKKKKMDDIGLNLERWGRHHMPDGETLDKGRVLGENHSQKERIIREDSHSKFYPAARGKKIRGRGGGPKTLLGESGDKTNF